MYSIGFVFNSSRDVSYSYFFLLDVKEAEFSIHKMIFREVGGYHEIHIGGLDVVFGRI